MAIKFCAGSKLMADASIQIYFLIKHLIAGHLSIAHGKKKHLPVK
jgi:hypothetical protein